MTSFLRKASWVALLGLMVLGVPVRAQETEQGGEEKKKSFWESLQDKGRSVQHAVEEVGHTLDETGHKLTERAQKILLETREKYVPILREAGYEVSEVRLTFSLAPAVTVRAVRFERTDDKERGALLEKYEDDRSVTAVLETVFAAEKVEVEGLEVKELHLTLGLQPRATVVLIPTDAAQVP